MTRLLLTTLLIAIFGLSGWTPRQEEHQISSTRTDAPNEVAILFLFDVSGSMNDNNKMVNAKQAAISTIQYICSQAKADNLVPYISIMAYSGDCTPNPTSLVQKFTSDTAAVRIAIANKLPAPNGNTPTPKAIENADNYLRQQLKSSGNCEGTLIILTDGQSTCGSLRPAGAYSEAKTNKVIIPCAAGTGDYALRYQAIGFDINPGSDAENDLKYLASTHNGKYFHAENGEDLKKVFEKVGRIFVPIEKPQSVTKMKQDNISEFNSAVNLIKTKNYDTAFSALNILIQKFPDDSAVIYNYAMMCEAREQYKSAIVNYEKYLKQNPLVPTKLMIEETITKLRSYFPDQFSYQKQVVNSDMNFVDGYMKKMSTGQSIPVASEFTSFIKEKSGFYETLPSTLGIDEPKVQVLSKEVVTSLKNVQRQIDRANMNWDQSAIPLVSLIYRKMKTLNEFINELQLK